MRSAPAAVFRDRMAAKEGEDVSVQVAVRLRPFVHAYEINLETREPLKHISKVVTIDDPTVP